jgi:hypothetical protein
LRRTHFQPPSDINCMRESKPELLSSVHSTPRFTEKPNECYCLS